MSPLRYLRETINHHASIINHHSSIISHRLGNFPACTQHTAHCTPRQETSASSYLPSMCGGEGGKSLAKRPVECRLFSRRLMIRERVRQDKTKDTYLCSTLHPSSFLQRAEIRDLTGVACFPASQLYYHRLQYHYTLYDSPSYMIVSYVTRSTKRSGEGIYFHTFLYPPSASNHPSGTRHNELSCSV